MNWDQFWMGMAKHVATKSKDPSTKLGVVIVSPNNDLLSMGYNGFPRGVQEEEMDVAECPVHGFSAAPNPGFSCACRKVLHTVRWNQRPEKYRWVEHAERNAVYNAARLGRSLLGSIAYINGHSITCSDCTRAFIQAGVREVVGLNITHNSVGKNVVWMVGEIEETMFLEAGVKTRLIEDF